MYMVKRGLGMYENDPNEILEKKNIILKRQNKFDRIKSRLDIAKEEKIATELEDIVTEGIQKNLNRSPVS